MSEVVDHLAEMTGFRDRDVMDVTLVTALRELLEPLSVAIYRCVGEPGEERWLTRARLAQGDAVPTADPLWSDSAVLPLATDFPARLECLHNRKMLQLPAGPHWVALFPIATDREVVGVVEIETSEALAPNLQRIVGGVLRIYHNFQGLLDYSERDTLTGLLNRKTFEDSFLKAVSEAPSLKRSMPPDDGRRQDGPHPQHYLGVIDIDHFKRVNDNFGHLIGDEVLLLLSRLMRSSFRFHDLLYRFGGEEFVALMRCDDPQDAAQAFERLRQNTENYVFPQVGHITVSVGFTLVKPGDSPSSAFDRADKAVYFSKQAGRNQVNSHADLVRAGHLKEESRASAVELF